MCISFKTFFTFALVNTCRCEFDYQVGERVKDSITDYLNYVEKSANVPNAIIKQGKHNITDAFSSGPGILFPSLAVHKNSLPAWFYGLETGYAVLYFADLKTCAAVIVRDAPLKPLWVEYLYNPVTGDYLKKNGVEKVYDIKIRLWYNECKAANKIMPGTSVWSTPFFSAGTGLSAIAHVMPIRNITIGKVHYPEFAGAVATYAGLNDISNYLNQSFSRSDYKIFVVDKLSLNIIANSWGAPNTIRTSFILASNSSDKIIREATRILIKKQWTEELFVLGSRYVQCFTHVDKLPGLQWYVVILQPAQLIHDHLGDFSVLYNAVIGMAAVTIFVIAMGLTATVIFLKSRLLKLTRPMFTVIVLVGSTGLAAYCLTLLGENTASSCAIRPWLFNLSFTLAFAPLLIKAWRVHLLFNVNPFAKNKLIANSTLAAYTLSLVAVDIFLLGITLYVGGKGTAPFTATEQTSSGAHFERTYCSYQINRVFFLTEIVFKGLLIFTACVLSFLIRKIAGTIAASKTLLLIVYNVGFISGIVLLLGGSLSLVQTRIFLQVMGICFCVIVAVMALVGPTLHQLLTIGDDEAMEDVMQEVFDKKASMKSGSVVQKPAVNSQKSQNSSTMPSSMTQGMLKQKSLVYVSDDAISQTDAAAGRSTMRVRASVTSPKPALRTLDEKNGENEISPSPMPSPNDANNAVVDFVPPNEEGEFV